MIYKLNAANPDGPWLRAYDPFNANGRIVGAIEADTCEMRVTIARGPELTSVQQRSFFLRVDDTAPDDFKRLYLPFVAPAAKPLPA